jgi:hypothetical protein
MIGAIVVACWVMTGYKLRHLLRDPRNPALRYLCLTLAALSVSLSLDPFDATLDRVAGTRDVGMVIGNCLVVIAANAAQAVLMHFPGTGEDVRRRVYNRNRVMLACVVLLVTVFVLTPRYHGVPTPAAAPYTVIYALIYGGYVAWAAAQGAILSLRFARSATQVLLRLGLRLAATGSLLGVCYAAARIVESIVGTAVDALITVLYTTTTVVLLVAATIPSWGQRIGLDRAWADLSARRDCQRLQPLWDLVYEAAPEVALLPHPAQPPLRRVRMIVEILDGYVRLAPWMSGAAAEVNVDAETGARLLTIAARDRLAGRPPAGERTVAALPWECETDAAAQVARLIRVARALHHLQTAQTPPVPVVTEG